MFLPAPAEALDKFNSNMAGLIEVIEYFTGAKLAGSIDPATCLPTGWRTA
jgi:hypothetical protein